MTSLAPARLPGLDGIRALAVLAVLLFHQNLLPFGWIGVQIFFVLSGYLISRILLRTREQAASTYFRDFYGRRALRIFPLYYGTLALLTLLSFILPKETTLGFWQGLPYALTYTYNIWVSTDYRLLTKLLTHLWSLCLEEQIYLIWPLLFWFFPRTKLRLVLAGLGFGGPFIRGFSYWLFSQPWIPGCDDTAEAIYSLTTTHLDAFAVGGFFALFPSVSPRKAFFRVTAVLLLGGALVLLLNRGSVPLRSLGYPLSLYASYGYIWAYSILNLFAIYLIQMVARGEFFPRFFALPWLNSIGKISYGVYIFHFPIQAIIGALLPRAPHLLQVAIQVAVTLTLAELSFRYFESPLTNLKDIWFPQTPHVPESNRPLRPSAS